jgi:multidrug efflux system membrane fusion protein
MISAQQLDAQQAQVRQFAGSLASDQAGVNGARLQLTYSRVVAPISGRLGLRQVDVGNVVRAADPGGIVTITQTQPVNAIFAIPADSLAPVLKRLRAGETLQVEAYDREGKTRLATGALLTADNQIDSATGTVKLKAEFPNADDTLFPDQFVNIRLRVETRHGALLIPVAAIQRGTQGTFCYVIQEKTAAMRPVTLGPVSGETVAVEKGLAPGELVVVDGADKLRQGAAVEATLASELPPGDGRGPRGGPGGGDAARHGGDSAAGSGPRRGGHGSAPGAPPA